MCGRGRGAANAQGSLKNARERKLDTIVRQFKGELHVQKKKKRLAPGVALKQDEMLFALGCFKLVRVVVFFTLPVIGREGWQAGNQATTGAGGMSVSGPSRVRHLFALSR